MKQLLGLVSGLKADVNPQLFEQGRVHVGQNHRGVGLTAFELVQLLIHISRMTASAAPSRESQYDPKIQQVLSYINEHLHEELTVDQLADLAYLSKYHFMRLFKAQTGSTVHAYVRQKRLLYAARLIREGESAARAAAESGFSDYSAFHRAFRECFGISPGQLKK